MTRFYNAWWPGTVAALLVVSMGFPTSTDGAEAADNSGASDSGSGGNSAQPFLAIAKRNAFGIKPPPPPVAPEPAAPPPPPPSNLFLTGITFLNGIRKAYLVQVEAAGKTPKYITLDEAHGNVDGLQLLAIDARKRIVRVLNGGQELTLNFKDNGWKGGGTPPPAAGAPPGARPLPQPTPQAAASVPPPAAVGGPTIIRRGGGTGVSSYPPGGGTSDGFAGGTPGVVGDNSGGVRELPTQPTVYLGSPAEPPAPSTVPAVFPPVANGGAAAPVPGPPVPGAPTRR